MPLDILVVDDSAAIRKILQRVLHQIDLPIGKIVEAGDGVQALEALAREKVQLVLTDINMPNMNGLELLGRIRKEPELRSLPVLMITTEGGEAAVTEAVTLGANGYVRKPFTADQIKEKLQSVV